MVKSLDEQKKIIEEALEKLYEEAIPSKDYQELKKKVEKNYFDQPVYRLHYLDREKAEEIVEEVLDQYDLRKMEEKRIRSNVFLGACPMDNLERVNEYRDKEGLVELNP